MSSKFASFWRKPIRALAFSWGLTTVVLSLLGPFGTFPVLSLVERLVYWGSVIGLAVVLIAILRCMTIELVGRSRHPFFIDAILVPAFVLLYSPPLHFFTVRAAHDLQPFSLMQTGFIVFGVSMILIATREVFGLHAPGVALPTRPDADPTKDGDNDPDSALTRSAPILLDRLPPETRGKILAISGSDHYVEVHTDRGEASVLLRFADAMREIDGVPGERVHRSHWVAADAVQCVRRDRTRQFVVLQCGRELPVSRTYAQRAFELWGEKTSAPISQ